MNRRIRNRTYGGVRGRELITPSYSIVAEAFVAEKIVTRMGNHLRSKALVSKRIFGRPSFIFIRVLMDRNPVFQRMGFPYLCDRKTLHRLDGLIHVERR